MSASESQSCFGDLTFLFTDIEGSTRLWQKQPDWMRAALASHDGALRVAITSNGGAIFKTLGDAFCAVFSDPSLALQAALAGQRALAREVPDLRVRMAVHSGPAEGREGDYFGPALNQVSRLLAAGHGGQILLSRAAADQVTGSLPPDTELRLLGRHQLRDIAAWEAIFQLQPPDLPHRFPPLNTSDVAFRRGAVRVASIAGVILAIVGGLAFVAVENGRRAMRQERIAVAGRRAFHRHLYAAQMNLAGRACQEGRIGAARVLVEAQRPAPERGSGREEDLRDFAWRYLWQISRSDDRAVLSPGTGQVNSVAFSPDGRIVAAGTAQGTVRLWEAESQRLVAESPAHQGPVASLAFALGGSLLVTLGGEDHSIRVWSVGSDGLSARQTMPGARSFSTGLSVDASGRTLAAAGADGSVHLWDLRSSGASSHTGRSLGLRPQGALALSRDGRWLAAWVGGPPDHAVEVRAVAPGAGRPPASGARTQPKLLRGHQDILFAMASSPRDDLLATCSADDTVKLWELATGRERWTFTRHASGVTCVTISPDGRTVASGGADATIRLISTASGEERFVLRGHTGSVAALAFSPDGSTLASASWDGTVRLWDTELARLHQARSERAPSELIQVAGPGLSNGMAAFSPDGKTLAVGEYQRVTFWDVSRPGGRPREVGPPLRAPSPEEAFNTLTWAPREEGDAGGAILATSTFAGAIRLWDARTRKQVARFRGSGLVTLHLQLAREGRLVTGSGVGAPTVRVWDVAARGRDGARYPNLLAELPGEKGTSLGPAAISPDGRFVATGSPEHQVTLWEFSPPARRPRKTASLGSVGALFSLAFSTDGTIVAAGGQDGTVSLWDVATRQLIRSFHGHAGPAMGIAFCPDRKTLATGGVDHLVKLWRLDTDQEVATLSGHRRAVYSVAFSPDGNTLASSSTDGTARLWRAASFVETDRLAPHRGVLDPASGLRPLAGLYEPDHTGSVIRTLAGRDLGRYLLPGR